MYLETLLIALREIRRNALRSFLTVLGIIIGVGSVIVMSTIGSGATAKVTADIAKLGTNMLSIRPGQRHGPGGASAEAKQFDMADVEAIRNNILNLEAVAPSSSQGMTAVFGNENWATNVMGTTNDYLAVRDWNLAEGREFLESEERAGQMVCIIGETVRKNLFGKQEPVGTHIRLNKLSCEVVGLLQSKGVSGFGSDQDDIVLVPIRAFQRRIAGNQDIRRIYLSVNDGASTDKAQKDVSLLLRERRRVKPSDEDDFSIFDMKEISDTMAGTTQVLTALLSAVAAVSLLVGGIGIMNIMLVSVTERTREIGTRLAIGAREYEVLLQFLVEAVVLSSLGGVMGIFFAIVASFGLTRLLGVPYVLDPSMILLAFLFSIAVGVAFGFLPARKAARLNPIEALRHE
jgi:putative ABC transport system permease protein